MNQPNKKFIDIDRVFREKNPGLYAIVPSFLVRWVQRIVQEDVINRILEENHNLTDFDFCSNICERYNVKVVTRGAENIPAEGGAIFAANHPLGGMDAMAIMDSISHYRSDVKFLVNDLLMGIKNLSGLFVGINKFGGNARDSIRQVDELFASNNAVFIFPAGMVSRMTRYNVIRDLEWKKTFVAKARKHKKPIVPVHISGRLSRKFYRISKLRKFLGIKVNIEMLYLVEEMFKMKNSTITITYGPPIQPETLDRSKSDDQWAYFVKNKVYELKG